MKHTLTTCCLGSVSSQPEQCRTWSCLCLLNKKAEIFFSSCYLLFLDVKQENHLKDHCFCIVLFHYSTLPLINPVLCSSGLFCGLRHSPQCLAAPRALPWSFLLCFQLQNWFIITCSRGAVCSCPGAMCAGAAGAAMLFVSTRCLWVARWNKCWTGGPILHPTPQPSLWICAA